MITVRRRLGGRIRLGVGAWREEAIGSWGRGVGAGRGRGGFPEGRVGRLRGIPRGLRETGVGRRTDGVGRREIQCEGLVKRRR